MRLLERINSIVTWLAQWSLLLLFVLIMLQIVTRYVFNDPLIWTEELARFVMVWMIFAIAGPLYADDEHIKVTFIDSLLLPGGVRLVRLLADLLVLGGTIPLVFYSYPFILRTFSFPSPALSFPMGLLYAAGAFGMFFIAVNALANILRAVACMRLARTSPPPPSSDS